MKNRIQPLLSRLMLSLLLITGTNLSISAQNEELTETRLLDSFDKIAATNGINILLRKGNEEKAKIRINNGLLSDVITEVSEGTLNLKMRPHINKELSVLVVVYYKTLHEASITKGASLETKTIILTDHIKLNANTGGSIKAEIECSDVKVNAGSGANIALYGWAKRFEANANTKAIIQTKNLNADNAFVKAATGSEIWVKPKDYLEAIANTGGTIFYTRTPLKKNEKVSSGGEIRNKTVKIGNDLIRDVES